MSIVIPCNVGGESISVGGGPMQASFKGCNIAAAPMGRVEAFRRQKASKVKHRDFSSLVLSGATFRPIRLVIMPMHVCECF
jgi:hypothetical protein